MEQPISSPSAQLVLDRALEAARELNHTYIGTEHLLMGLVSADPRDPAAQTLKQLGINSANVRHQIVEIIGVGRAELDDKSEQTPTQRVAKVYGLAEQYANGAPVEPIHILYAIAREGEGVAAQVLVKLRTSANEVGNKMVQQGLVRLATSTSPPVFAPDLEAQIASVRDGLLEALIAQRDGNHPETVRELLGVAAERFVTTSRAIANSPRPQVPDAGPTAGR